MVEFATILLLVIAAVASLFTAWTIGAGSSGATPFAPAVGANAISIMEAGFVVGILGFLGAVLQGAAVTETIGGELIGGVTLSPLAATIALVVAAGLILVGIFTGYPIATAFAVAGAVVGVGLAMGGTPAWHTYEEILLLWVLTPPVGIAAAYLTAKMLRTDRVPEEVAVPFLAGIVGIMLANMEFTLLGSGGEAASLVDVVSASVQLPDLAVLVATSALLGLLGALPVARAARRDVQRAMRRFLLALGALVAFSAGAGKVGLAIGPLLPLFDTAGFAVPILAVLFFGGIGLLLGSWMASTRMIKALARDYSDLGPRRSIAVLIPSFAIAQAAIFYGLPMSFNEIFVSTIIGSGLAAGRGGVSRRKIIYTGLAWVGSLAIGLGVSYGALAAIRIVV